MNEIEWQFSATTVDYLTAVAAMNERAERIARGEAAELIWLLEHPPLFTAGTSADPAELLTPSAFPVYESGRGGRYTYHGPGQRVVYVMLDLNRRGRDIRAFVCMLENWIIAALAQLGVTAFRRDGRIGVWVKTPNGSEAKIAAIGVRIKRWVTLHGFAINVSPELDHYSGIIPCGISDFGITSLAALGRDVTMVEVDQAIKNGFSPPLLRGSYLTQIRE